MNTAAKKQMGRPTFPPGIKKEHTSFRFSPTIKTILALESQQHGISQAKVIERAVTYSPKLLDALEQLMAACSEGDPQTIADFVMQAESTVNAYRGAK